MPKLSTIVVQPADHLLLRKAAVNHNKRIQEVTHEAILEGLKVVAPEVLEPEVEPNGLAAFTLEEFEARYVSEEEALSEPVLL